MAPHNEEISTIFVVGFPEDMQEREFQNMFIFSPGFEAATLKVPEEEDMNNKKQIVRAQRWKGLPLGLLIDDVTIIIIIL